MFLLCTALSCLLCFYFKIVIYILKYFKKSCLFVRFQILHGINCYCTKEFLFRSKVQSAVILKISHSFLIISTKTDNVKGLVINSVSVLSYGP